MKPLFTNQSDKKLTDADNQAIVKKATTVFTDKDYIERYKLHYFFSLYGGYVLQVLTALFASFFFYTRFDGFIKLEHEQKFFLVLFITIVTMVIIEVAKRMNISDFIKSLIRNRHNKENRIAWKSFAISIVIVAVSIVSTVIGSKEAAENYTDKSAEIEAQYQLLKDSIESKYDGLIAATESSTKKFKKSITWKGNIDMSNKEIRKILAANAKEKSTYLDQKIAALSKLDLPKSIALDENKEKSKSNAESMLWIALLLELCSYICIRFCFIYLANVYILENKPTEPEQKGDTSDQQQSTNLEVPGSAGVNPDAKPRPAIGFNYPTNPNLQAQDKPHINTPINTLPDDLKRKIDDEGYYIKKYPRVANKLIEGASLNEARKVANVSKSTAQKVKWELRAFQILKDDDNECA